MFSMFVSRQGENSITSRKILRRVQDGGVITRFSSKDFIRLGNALFVKRKRSDFLNLTFSFMLAVLRANERSVFLVHSC